MIKSKFLAAVVLAAPLLGMVSCQQNNTGEMVTVTLDANEGEFVSCGSYKTLSIVKGSPLSSALDELPMVKAEDFSPNNGISDTLYPAIWVDDEGESVPLNYRINSDILLHANYCPSIDVARSAVISKISKNLIDACSRQPEAIDRITEVYDSVINHISIADNESALFGIKEVAIWELDEFAKDPETIGLVSENAELYFQAIKDLKFSAAYGLGHAGGQAMQGFGIAEDKTKLSLSTEVIIKEAKLMPQYCGHVFGKFSGELAYACAKNNENIETILKESEIAFDGFKRTKNSYQANHVSEVARSWADKCKIANAEEIEKLTTLLSTAIENILGE